MMEREGILVRIPWGRAVCFTTVEREKQTALLPCLCGDTLTGLLGYFRRGLIDPGSAVPFILASLPACLLGALIVPYADERVLKALYAVFMIGLSGYLFLDDQG